LDSGISSAGPALKYSEWDGMGWLSLTTRIGLSANRFKIFSKIWEQRVYQTSIGRNYLSVSCQYHEQVKSSVAAITIEPFLPVWIGPAMQCRTYHTCRVGVN